MECPRNDFFEGIIGDLEFCFDSEILRGKNKRKQKQESDRERDRRINAVAYSFD